MESFIVLGIIPGTHYQTTFMFWVYVTYALVCMVLLGMIFSKRSAIRAYIVARKISRLINNFRITA
jgi:hypothetical protein